LGSAAANVFHVTRNSMQKLIRAMLAGMLLSGLSIGLTGCADESSVKTVTEVKGPGGTATRTDETKVKTTGENPPVAPVNKTP
jgi:hypothetical protein